MSVFFFQRSLLPPPPKQNRRLQIKICPLQRNKRLILIDQLLFDCQVLAIIEEQAQRDNILRYGLQQRVKSFARKVVLSFNACGYASVSFGVPISMCSYSEERVLALNHLEKKPRIVKVIELAESL